MPGPPNGLSKRPLRSGLALFTSLLWYVISNLSGIMDLLSYPVTRASHMRCMIYVTILNTLPLYVRSLKERDWKTFLHGSRRVCRDWTAFSKNPRA